MYMYLKYIESMFLQIFSSSGGTLGRAILKDVLQGLEPLGATQVVGGAFGYDIEPWQNENVSSISLLNANEQYFYYHHTLGMC